MYTDITVIHDKVYELLNEINSNKAVNLRFTLRRTNRNGRLEDGYWFYGNDSYLALSFWSGTDWKNRTPNIIFVILPDQSSYLEINTSDSKMKRVFIEEFIEGPLDLIRSGKRFYKYYPGNSYLESLRSFLRSDKKRIDGIIRNEQSFFNDANEEDVISFIELEDFLLSKDKVDQFRNLVRTEFFPERNQSIKSILIKNYGPIKEVLVDDIPQTARWIFLTGENGTGKTSFLRALTTVLTSRKIEISESNGSLQFEILLELYSNKENITVVSRINNERLTPNKLWVNGFAAYGAIRLNTNNSGSLKSKKKTSSTAYNLFNNDGVLIDLLYKSSKWIQDHKNIGQAERRLYSIREILQDIIPNLNKIVFEENNTLYYEEDVNEDVYEKPVVFEQLASGIKSMIAMIGDMLCRLFDQQPEIDDASELSGVVIIDEIDIHLHPKLQRMLVEELDKSFRKIQFIVSTHSPIPLLGAPSGSLIFKIDRNALEGVKLTRLDQKIYLADLLPNTILTSPIFGLENIVPNSHDGQSIVRTETNYDEIQFRDRLKGEINDFITDKKEKELIELFKKRRSK